MADAFHWPVPVNTPVPTIRKDPAKLPPAGRPCHRDSWARDYREFKYHEDGNTRLRTTASWIAPPTRAHPRFEPTREQAIPTKWPSNRPNLFDVSDIQCARPGSRPGLTIKRRSDTAGEYGSFVNGRSGRVTHPLDPHYQLGDRSARLPAHPLERVECATKEGHAFYLRRHLDWGFDAGDAVSGTLDVSDIPGASPAQRARQGRQQYRSLDYSDVPRSVSEQCRRHVARARDGRPPIDTHPLGLWCSHPDPHMERSTRRTDPLNPIYHIHGRTIKPPNLGGARRTLGRESRP